MFTGLPGSCGATGGPVGAWPVSSREEQQALSSLLNLRRQPQKNGLHFIAQTVNVGLQSFDRSLDARQSPFNPTHAPRDANNRENHGNAQPENRAWFGRHDSPSAAKARGPRRSVDAGQRSAIDRPYAIFPARVRFCPQPDGPGCAQPPIPGSTVIRPSRRAAPPINRRGPLANLLINYNLT